MVRREKSLPSFLTAGLVSACRNFCAVCDATLTEFWLGGRGVENALRDDLCSDAANAGTGQADRAGGARGQVEHPAADERAAVVDGDDDAAAAIGQAGAFVLQSRCYRRAFGAHSGYSA